MADDDAIHINNCAIEEDDDDGVGEEAEEVEPGPDDGRSACRLWLHSSTGSALIPATSPLTCLIFLALLCSTTRGNSTELCLKNMGLP